MRKQPPLIAKLRNCTLIKLYAKNALICDGAARRNTAATRRSSSNRVFGGSSREIFPNFGVWAQFLSWPAPSSLSSPSAAGTRRRRRRQDARYFWKVMLISARFLGVACCCNLVATSFCTGPRARIWAFVPTKAQGARTACGVQPKTRFEISWNQTGTYTFRKGFFVWSSLEWLCVLCF